MNYSHFADYYGGNKSNKACIDGYHLSPYLEFILFVLEIKSDNTLDVYVSEQDKEYLYSEFTKEQIEKWCNDIKNDAPIGGMYFLKFDNPENSGELYLYDTNNVNLNDTKQKPIIINNGLNFSEVMSKVSKLSEEKDKEDKEEEDLKKSVIGKFKPKRKFLNFISGVSGARVRFIRETSFIDGAQLSGVLENIKFKITICDEGTIDFEEVDTNVADEAMIKRLIDSIDEMDVTGYTQKFVVANLEFKDKDGNRCYLEVEHEKPIEKFASILEMFKDEEEKAESTKVSDKCLSLLDSLFSDDVEVDDVEVEEEIEVVEDVIEEDKGSTTNSYLEESFRKMNEDKINELKSRIEKSQLEISRFKSDISNTEKKVEKEKESLSILETRLESLMPKDEPNGYVFNVSEFKTNDIELDEKTKEVADKIGDLMGLKKDVLFEHLKGGYHIIKIADKNDISEAPKDINTEVLMKIKNLDVDGKLSITGDGEFEYRGDLNWHQLVDRMIKKGFEQDEEFDKLSGSNSYESKEGSKEDSKAESMF